MIPLNAFLGTGTFVLAWQAWNDLKDHDLKEPNIFSKRSWFMQGCLLILVLTTGFNIWLYASLSIGIALLLSLKQIKKVLGEGDIEAFRWIFTGLIILSPVLLVWFSIYLCFFTISQSIGRKLIQTKKIIPFFPTIFAAFIIIDLMEILKGLNLQD